MEFVKSEALRYLGYKGTPDEATERYLERAVAELKKHITPKFTYMVISKADCPLLSGNDITEHLKNCGNVIVFAATLGNEADRLIAAAQITDMAYAVILDAVASAMIEEYCDECENEIGKTVSGFFTSRFSMGYGDYPIALQRNLIRFIQADRKIGLNTTESLMLVPVKSVTAIIGISEHKTAARKRGCESCNLKDSCGFRKEKGYCENK